MKNFQIPLVAFALLLGACSSMQNTSRYTANDDLYYSLADAQKNSEKTYNQALSAETNAADRPAAEQETPNTNYSQYQSADQAEQNQNQQNQQNYSSNSDGNTTINNYYMTDEDDYYYSKRLRRFSNNYYGFGYYSPAYCGFYNDPFFLYPHPKDYKRQINAYSMQ